MKEKIKRNRLKACLLFGLLVFVSLSLYSYNPQDLSFNFVGLSLKVSNYCGFIGASLADWLYQFFGFSSWLIVLGGLTLSYKLLTQPLHDSHSHFLLTFLLFLSSSASLSELHLPSVSLFNGEVSLGGAFGGFIVSLLKPLFDTIGTAVILWSLSLVFLIFYGQVFYSASLKLPNKVLILLVIFAKKNSLYFRLIVSKLNRWLFKCLKTIPVTFRALFRRIKSLRKTPQSQVKDTKTSFRFFPFYKKPAQPELVKTLNEDKEQENSQADNKKPKLVFKESSLLNSSQDNSLESQQAVSLTDSQTLTNNQNLGTQSSLVPAEQSSTLNTNQDSMPLSEQNSAFSANQNQKITSQSLKNRLWSGLPSFDLLLDPPASTKKISVQDIEDLSKKLLDKLHQFSVKGEIKAIKTGPALVLFEFKPEDHVKVSQIRKMESDLSLALSSESIRIIAPIPGRDVVGIEASMPYREMVYLKNLIQQKEFFKVELPLVLGRRADNLVGIKDLARIPHLLVAGTTGSGKSMFIISFICSLLFRHSPQSLRLLLIDPKQVDLSSFKEVPHLLSPIITSAQPTVKALHWAIYEMEKRYRSLSHFQARDQKSFNEIVKKLSLKEKKEHELHNQSAEPDQAYYFEPLPLICIIIEEFGDLMADPTVRRPIENAVVRLAQKARASGIHLVLAMQSPRKDVVTGLIKTNIPGRISFKVASGTDSRIILDDTGAERLLSHGDMLFLEPGSLKATRYHGPFMRDKEVQAIANHWKQQSEPLYEEDLLKMKNKSGSSHLSNGSSVKEDPMYDEILNFVKNCEVISASLLQRKFQIGYPRAGRIIQTLFDQGEIGPPQGSKPREVLINK